MMVRTLAFAVGMATVFAAQQEALPAELRQLTEAVGCSPVADFFERPGMIDPPYLYGVRPGPREGSAAFWCAVEERPRYRLVIVERGSVIDVIEWDNYPGGLSVAESVPMDLGSFRYVDEPTLYGPKGQQTEYAPIWSEYDGAVAVFYKHGDRWLFKLFD